MSELQLTINGMDYELAGTLRVAYLVQGQHNHKSYMEVFRGVSEMPIEQQIDIVYAAFKVGNPLAAAQMSSKMFLEWALDNLPFKKLLMLVKSIINQIVGKDDEDESTESSGAEDQGN